MTVVIRKSILSGVTRSRDIPCTEAQLLAWEMGEGLIQVIMKDLSENDREFIMTGVTPDEWDSLFNET